MDVSYEILSIRPQDSYHFDDKGFIFIIILSGAGRLSSDCRPEMDILALDYLRLCPEEDYTFHADELTLIGFMHFTDYESTITGFFKSRTPQNEYIKKAFLFAIDLQSMDNPNRKEVMSSMCSLLWSLMVGNGIRELQPPPVVRQLISVIEERKSDPDLDLTREISSLGYSPGHLRRIFKQVVGIPPLEFLTRLRIDTAKAYIHEHPGKLSVSEVALASGYIDPNFFARQFKKHTGLSPQEYLQQFQPKTGSEL